MMLVVISHPNWLPDEAKLVSTLFAEGLKYYHLRKPGASVTEVEQFIGQLPMGYRNRIIIHNHLELAEKYALGGIHFNAATKDDFNNYKTWRGIRSWACHSLDELKIVPMQVNYVFLSPIFPSISKPAYRADWNKTTLKTILNKRNTHQAIIALGGISVNRVDEAYQLGFKGVAVLGSVWEPMVKEKDGKASVANFRLLREKCQKTDRLY